MEAKIITLNDFGEISQLDIEGVTLFVINEFNNDDEFKSNDVFDVELYCYQSNLGNFEIQKSKYIQ